MTNAELNARIDALTAHVRALQTLTIALAELAFDSEDIKQSQRRSAETRVTENALPLRNEPTTLDAHEVALSSLRAMLDHPRRTQLKAAN